MANEIYVKHYFGEKSKKPEEVENGAIIYETDTRAIYVDQDDERKRYNPPADWNETNEESPSYIANKPDLGDILENASTWNILEKPDPWEAIINNQNYATDYQIGKLVDLDFGEYGVHPMELVAMDADDKADGSGKARMTWISKDIITKRRANPAEKKGKSWNDMELRTWIEEELLNSIPIKDSLVLVNKTYFNYDSYSTEMLPGKIWIPSYREVRCRDGLENSGVMYTGIFSEDNDAGRIKLYNGTATDWWLRSHSDEDDYCQISINPTGSTSCSELQELGVVIGFCL